jgi:hypothetical protein
MNIWLPRRRQGSGRADRGIEVEVQPQESGRRGSHGKVVPMCLELREAV